jgi:hypothetical protein
MPVRYTIHKELRLVLTVGEGVVTIDEMKAHQDELLRDPNFDPNFDQLNDYTAATNAAMSAEEVRDFAWRSVFSPTSRRAVVATKPEHFGLGRVYEGYHAERANVHVFYNRDEALKWLGIPEDSGLF